MSRKAYVVCTGCPESRIDTTRIKNFLTENGWDITNQVEESDLVIFRACGLTTSEVQKALQVIRTLNVKKKKEADLIVWGCLSKINQKALREVYDGVTFGEDKVELFNKIIEAKKPVEEVVANSCMPLYSTKKSMRERVVKQINRFVYRKAYIAGNDSMFKIKVSTGCLDNCSFCGVKISRGRVSSKSIDQIIAEFKDGLTKGFKDFCLLGTDLGAYGKDLGIDLADLLIELIKIEGDYKIGLRNINPAHLKQIFEKLRPILASGKIWYLSTAAESGSDRILKLMHRRYTIQEFIKIIKIINEEYPNIYLSTQLIAGFPSETEKDFQLSIQLIHKVKFDNVEIYKFSPNIGTIAAEMNDQIPESVKLSRYRRLFVTSKLQDPIRKIRWFLSSFID
jgi:MiaB/RimO family radical SAM methylthiotransferase